MTVSLILLGGMLVLGGLVAVIGASVPAPPGLQPALDRLGGDRAPADLRRVDTVAGSTSERLGALVYRRSPVPLTPRQRQLLRLQDKPVAEFYADKIVMAVVGAILPALVGFGWGLMTGRASWWPAGLALIGLVLGFFVPDLLLRRSGKAGQARAVESLLIFIDLVTLERLANASATEALQSAAALSDVPLFVQIRTALERARLEQQSPYGELRRLADELELPELKDVADIMQLDESGAALSGTLRARVKELRNAHLTREQIAAGAAAEGMTIYMTIPALIFGMIFLGAAMLTLLFEV
jgi:alkylhydroperoxidase family enzyme